MDTLVRTFVPSSRRFQKFMLLAILLTSGLSAHASTLFLTQVNGNLYQQNAQNPCIFENPSCQQGGFQGVALDTGGNVTGYNVLSLVYTGSQLNTILNGG